MLSSSFALISSISSPAEFHKAKLIERLSKVSIVQHQDPMHSCRIALLNTSLLRLALPHQPTAHSRRTPPTVLYVALISTVPLSPPLHRRKPFRSQIHPNHCPIPIRGQPHAARYRCWHTPSSISMPVARKGQCRGLPGGLCEFRSEIQADVAAAPRESFACRPRSSLAQGQDLPTPIRANDASGSWKPTRRAL